MNCDNFRVLEFNDLLIFEKENQYADDMLGRLDCSNRNKIITVLVLLPIG